jgi:hypothetical protein
MTYARSRYALKPAEWNEKARDRFFPRALLHERKMVVAKSASTLPGPHQEPKARARRHRLNPGRRTVEQNRAAR